MGGPTSPHHASRALPGTAGCSPVNSGLVPGPHDLLPAGTCVTRTASAYTAVVDAGSPALLRNRRPSHCGRAGGRELLLVRVGPLPRGQFPAARHSRVRLGTRQRAPRADAACVHEAGYRQRLALESFNSAVDRTHQTRIVSQRRCRGVPHTTRPLRWGRTRPGTFVSPGTVTAPASAQACAVSTVGAPSNSRDGAGANSAHAHLNRSRNDAWLATFPDLPAARWAELTDRSRRIHHGPVKHSDSVLYDPPLPSSRGARDRPHGRRA